MHSIQEVEMEQAPLVGANIELYLSWLEEEFLKNPEDSTVKQKVMSVLGVSCGAISTLMSARIAYEFGASLTNEIPPYILGGFFGATTGITIGASMVTINYDFFRRLATDVPQSRTNLINNRFHHKLASVIFAGVFTGIASISSLNATYLTDDLFSDELGKATFLLDVPTFIANFAVSYWSLDKQIALLYTTLRYKVGSYLLRESIGNRIQMEHILESALYSVLKEIRTLSNTESDHLYSKVLGELAIQENSSEKLNQLFGLALKQENLTAHTSKVKSIFGFMGTCIGIISPYFILSVTQDAARWVCSLIGVQDEEVIDEFSKFLGWTSYITTAALSAYTSKVGFEKMYDTMSGGLKNKCRGIVDAETVLKFILASSATSYRLDLTLDAMKGGNIWTVLVGICSVLGPFSVYYWGLDVIKNKIKGLSNKDKLENIILQMIHLLPKMQDRNVKALYNYVNTIKQVHASASLTLANESTQSDSLQQEIVPNISERKKDYGSTSNEGNNARLIITQFNAKNAKTKGKYKENTKNIPSDDIGQHIENSVDPSFSEKRRCVIL
jgi:hypothetical protein